MTFMKRALCLLMILPVMLVFSSCGKKSELVGSWRNDLMWVFEFKSDNTWTLTLTDENGDPYVDKSGDYTYENDLLVMNCEDYEFNKCTVNITKDVMIWSFEDSKLADQFLKKIA